MAVSVGEPCVHRYESDLCAKTDEEKHEGPHDDARLHGSRRAAEETHLERLRLVQSNLRSGVAQDEDSEKSKRDARGTDDDVLPCRFHGRLLAVKGDEERCGERC